MSGASREHEVAEDQHSKLTAAEQCAYNGATNERHTKELKVLNRSSKRNILATVSLIVLLALGAAFIVDAVASVFSKPAYAVATQELTKKSDLKGEKPLTVEDSESTMRKVGADVKNLQRELSKYADSDAVNEVYSKASGVVQDSMNEVKRHARAFVEGYTQGGDTAPEAVEYDRSFFGDGWASVNGCDTRNRILQRDLTDKIMKNDCVVKSGTLHDPYTGEDIQFVKGASQVDIDHIVPLAWAWDHGASKWTQRQRELFANDVNNLVAVNRHDNRAKGDKDPNEWLPSVNKCEYTKAFIAIAEQYELDSSHLTTEGVCLTL